MCSCISALSAPLSPPWFCLRQLSGAAKKTMVRCAYALEHSIMLELDIALSCMQAILIRLSFASVCGAKIGNCKEDNGSSLSSTICSIKLLHQHSKQTSCYIYSCSVSCIFSHPPIVYRHTQRSPKPTVRTTEQTLFNRKHSDSTALPLRPP